MSSTLTTAVLPHEVLWTITNSAIAVRSLQLVAELGIADHIHDAPVSGAELALRSGADPGALERMLRLLAAYGIFEHRDGGYHHTDASRLLRNDHPMSMRAFSRMMGLPVLWATLAELDHSVRTGAPAVELVERDGFWAYLEAHPDEARVFGEAMQAKARTDIAAVLDAYDFRPFRTIADIGGGRGHLLHAALDAAPEAHGVLFDLPSVIDTLDIAFERLTTVGGDFFTGPLPAADAYVLMEIIHDWADTDATAILRAIRSAASPGAAVLIIENVLPEDRRDPRGQTLDIIMLAITGGRERTANDFGDLLHNAGVRRTAVVETAGPMRIVEAIAI